MASVCSALPQMRFSALMMPTLTDGGASALPARVRPRAMAVCPMRNSFLGETSGTTANHHHSVRHAVTGSGCCSR